MTQPTTYDPDLGVFLRTFNIRYYILFQPYEVQIKAKSWQQAEQMLKAIKSNGVVYSELVEVIE